MAPPRPADSTSRRRWARSGWAPRDFLHLWAGQSISLIGTQISTLALPTMAIFSLHARAVDVGLLGASQFLPFLVLGPFAGVVVDRFPRRPLMMLSDLARATALATVPLAAGLHGLSLVQLYAVALAVGTGGVLFDVAYYSYVPELVEPKHLHGANVRLEGSLSTALIAGPAVGGVLISTVGAPAAVGVDAASFVWSLMWLAMIRKAPRPLPIAPHRSVLREIREGATFISRNRILLRSIGAASGFVLGASATRPAFFVFVYDRLGLSPAVIGTVYAIGSLGGLGGVAIAGMVQRRLGAGKTMISAALLNGAAFIVEPLALLGLAPVTLTAAVVLGSLASSIFNVTNVTLRQTVTRDDMLGRVNAGHRTLTWGVRPLGQLAGGGCANVVGPVPVLIGGGLVATAAGLLLWTPTIKNARTVRDWAPESRDPAQVLKSAERV